MKLFIIAFLLIILQFSCAKNQNEKGENIMSDKFESATFGAGCFWCIEAIYQRVEGVNSVESGYSGGTVANPTYRQVTSGNTGHAEVIQIKYNPEIISYDNLLEIFLQTHDPTTLNRQGADIGTQYRSVIFYHSEKQKELAEYWKKKIDEAGIYNDSIVTEISPLDKFYVAEDYHQNYYNENRAQPYCAYVITPKVKKLEQLFKDKLK